MDKLKTRVLFISLIMLALISVSAVAAADDADVISANQDDFDLSEETINDIEQTSGNTEENAVLQSGSNSPLTAGESGSFTDLKHKIDGDTQGYIELDSDYIMNDGEEYIVINKTITIDGKGHKLDANLLDAIFFIKAPVTLKNITFVNSMGRDFPVYDYDLNEWDYVYGAVNLNYGAENSVIENCIFEDNEGDQGAAINSYCNNLKITNCKFEENIAGLAGAIYLKGNNTQITGSTFIKNQADDGGAILYSNETNGLSITGCVFEENNADNGGAITLWGDDVTIFGSNFTSNEATSFGGSIYTKSSNKGLEIDNCVFEQNKANNGGVIHLHSLTGPSVIKNSNFTSNKAYSYGGAIYCDSPNILLDHLVFTGNIAAKGGAIDVHELSQSETGGHNPVPVTNVTIQYSNFTENFASGVVGGGAISTTSPDVTIKVCNFIKNEAASYGGAISNLFSASKCDVFDSTFIGNTAVEGGAVLIMGTNSIINNSVFSNNNATNYGGAIEVQGSGIVINYTTLTANSADYYGGAIMEMSNGLLTIENSNLTKNNASYGSGIFKYTGSLVISNAKLLENLAISQSLTLQVADIKDDFDVLFKTEYKGGDNLLNGIYTNNLDVKLTNVTYHGFKEEMNTGDSQVTPVASADASNDGELIYKDYREAGINITISIYDENDNFLFNITKMTDIYGNNSARKLLPAGKYKAYAIHDEDAYYKYIKSEVVKFEIEYVDVFVTVDRVVNYTGAVVDVIANVTDAKGNNITGGTATFTIHYDNKISSSGLLMASSESYTAEVIDGKAVFKGITLGAPGLYPSTIEYSGNEYYNSAENESEVEVLPLNTTTSSHDVSGTAGDKVTITADIVDQNGNPVKNGTAVLTVNGKKYTAEVKDGKAVFKDVELPSKSTPATIDYLGNDYYNPSSTTIQITVTQPENNETEDEPSTPVSEKTVPVIPAAGNPIALAVMALLTLVSTVSLGRKK